MARTICDGQPVEVVMGIDGLRRVARRRRGASRDRQEKPKEINRKGGIAKAFSSLWSKELKNFICPSVAEKPRPVEKPIVRATRRHRRTSVGSDASQDSGSRIPQSNVVSLDSASNVDPVRDAQHRGATGQPGGGEKIKPSLKSWVRNVLVPAMVTQYIRERSAAGDNDGCCINHEESEK
jgi:hypothetical protein